MSGWSRRQFVSSAAVGVSAAAVTQVIGNALPANESTEQDTSSAKESSAEELRQLGKTAHTKFAVNIEMWWRKLPFMERLEKAAEFGFPAVEFWPYQGKDIPAIAKRAKELKIEIAQFTAWGFVPGMNDPKNEDLVVKTIEEACQVAHQLDCRKMCVVAGNDIPGVSQEEMHRQTIKALRRAAPIAEREKVMLILEPMNIRVDHKGHCLYGSPPTIRICKEVGSEFVKINWDLYHMHITEGDLCGRMKEGLPWIGYLQLADHPGRNEPGTGEIHYNRVLKEAYNLGYRDYVGLELNPTNELAAAKACKAADIW